MSRCRYCNRYIEWLKKKNGQYVPVDVEAVCVVEGDGRDSFFTEDGGIIVGRIARPEEENDDLPVALVSHWKTCGNRRAAGE